jgi:hypothetical protein
VLAADQHFVTALERPQPFFREEHLEGAREVANNIAVGMILPRDAHLYYRLAKTSDGAGQEEGE